MIRRRAEVGLERDRVRPPEMFEVQAAASRMTFADAGTKARNPVSESATMQRIESNTLGAPRTALRTKSLMMAAIAAALGGCGHFRFDLVENGEFPREYASVGTVEMVVGEKRRAITKVGDPRQWGYAPGLVSSNPEVLAVVYDDGSDGSVVLEAKSVGEARLAPGNAWARATESWETVAASSTFNPTTDSFIVKVVARDPKVP